MAFRYKLEHVDIHSTGLFGEPTGITVEVEFISIKHSEGIKLQPFVAVIPLKSVKRDAFGHGEHVILLLASKGSSRHELLHKAVSAICDRLGAVKVEHRSNACGLWGLFTSSALKAMRGDKYLAYNRLVSGSELKRVATIR